MVTCALGRSMKKAGMRVPYEVLSQKCREGWMYVGGGGWNSRELIMSPMALCVFIYLVVFTSSGLEAEVREGVWRWSSSEIGHKICSFCAVGSFDAQIEISFEYVVANVMNALLVNTAT